MAPRQLLHVAVAFAATAHIAAAKELSLAERVTAQECWTQQLSSEQTFYPTKFQTQSSSDVADLFEIMYDDTFKVIVSKLAKEQYVLTQCGQEPPSDDEVNKVFALDGYTRKHFTVPVQSAMAMSTVQLGFIDALEVQDRVNYVGSFVSAPCWQQALKCGAKIESGNKTHLALQQSSVDVVFMDCGSNCASVTGMSNGVHVPTTQEDGALATAEYIKYIGAFFNLEPKANDLFSATKLAYEQAASGAASSKPVVAWIHYTDYAGPGWNQPAYVVSMAAYKMGLVTDAGGINFDAAAAMGSMSTVAETDAVFGNPAGGKTYTVFAQTFNSSDTNTLPEMKVKAAAEMMSVLSSVDVVIDETYAYVPGDYTYETFLNQFGLTSSSDFKFVKNNMVLRFDRTISENNGLDWFESRIAKPDWALEGLANVLHDDTSKRAKYFRNVAKGDTPDQVLTASMCSDTLPVCETSVAPETIVIDGPVGPNAGDSDVSGSSSFVLPAFGLVAVTMLTLAGVV